MVVEELSLISKTGSESDCEDAICISDNYAAVIDGASSKTERRWNGMTGGMAASRALREAIYALDPDCTLEQATCELTRALHELYVRFNCVDQMQRDAGERASAAVAIFSRVRREVWMIGDCQCLIREARVWHRNTVDDVTAAARAFFLSSELARGVPLTKLTENDTGRKFIAELLERQSDFQNSPTGGPYFYAAIDGTAIPPQGLVTVPVPLGVSQIVLATDGYPILKPTLKESEEALRSILETDPMMIGEFKSTKGVRTGWGSFDDRAFVRITVP